MYPRFIFASLLMGSHLLKAGPCLACLALHTPVCASPSSENSPPPHTHTHRKATNQPVEKQMTITPGPQLVKIRAQV